MKAQMQPRDDPRPLLYIGEGRKVDDLPRRDLTPSEVEQFGGIDYLKSTGLYTTPDEIAKEFTIAKPRRN